MTRPAAWFARRPAPSRPATRPARPTGVVAISLATAVALALFAWSLTQPGAILGGVTLVLALGSLAAIARVSLATAGVGFVLVFSFTASWDQASIGGLRPRLIFLILGLILLVMTPGATRFLRVPWWIHVYAAGAVAVTVLQFYFPTPAGYLANRYLTSAAGLALGSRPGAFPSLLSLLVNSYAVPLAVLLACAVVPRALRWITVAFVAGAALSNLAGYLGFQGAPFLLNPLVTPPPPGVRALGYTSHPLHLATSAVMAVGLACWLSVQPGHRLKWVGRASLVALLLGLYASGSRGGNAAAAAALGLSALLLPSIRRRIYTVAAVVAIAFAALVALSPSLGTEILRTTRLYGGLTNDVSDTGRGEVFDQALSDFRHSPVWGIGVRYIAEAHVLYTGVLASGGVILFLVYLAFNYGSLSAVRRVYHHDRALGGALATTLLSSLLYWSVADDFQVASVQIVYGLLLAALLGRDRDAGDAPGPADVAPVSAPPDRSRPGPAVRAASSGAGALR